MSSLRLSGLVVLIAITNTVDAVEKSCAQIDVTIAANEYLGIPERHCQHSESSVNGQCPSKEEIDRHHKCHPYTCPNGATYFVNK
jgi:hypothetical protein